MRLKVYYVVLVASFMAFSHPAFAQVAKAPVRKAVAKPAPVVVEAPKPKQFTQVDVLKLVAAGFTDQEIVAAIEKAENKSFDTDALVELKAKVSPRVMAAVQGIPYVEPVVVAPVAPTAVAIKASNEPAPAEKKEGCEEQHFSTFRKLVGKCGDKKNDGNAADKSNQATDAIPTPKRNQPVVFTAQLSGEAACKQSIKYLTMKNLQMAQPVDCATGQISTVSTESKNFNLNNNFRRVILTFVDTNSQTEVRVSVMDKGSGFLSVNGGKSDGEKGEGVNIKESLKIATDLRDTLNTGMVNTTSRQ